MPVEEVCPRHGYAAKLCPPCYGERILEKRAAGKHRSREEEQLAELTDQLKAIGQRVGELTDRVATLEDAG
jgi:hypothetical protein